MIQTLSRAPVPFTGTEVHTLPNGLRLIVKEDRTAPVVSIQAWTKCGAVNETPNIYGISHGLEHMVFKGTPTRSAGEISQMIEGHGGAMNAATQLETTHYYIDIPSYGAKTALDVLADTILHPTFPQDELERERLVILEEIHSRDDSPDATLWDEFASQVFSGSAYAIKVIGNESTVSAMSQADLFTYFKSFYVPSNKCVVVIGDFDKNEMLADLRRLFESEKAGTAPAAPKIQIDRRDAANHVLKKPVELAHIAMGIPTEGLGSKAVVALDMLSDIVAGAASSRMYQKLREEKQVVLSLTCDYTPFSQKGLFAFFAETLPKNADLAIKMIQEEINGLRKAPIREDELNRAKARTKSEWLHGSETPRGQASTLGSLAVLNHLDLIESYISDVDAMTVSDLMNTFEQHIEGKPYAVTQILPQ